MKYLSLILVVGLVFGFSSLTFGAESSKELTQQAATALAQGKTKEAQELAQKCIDTFGEEAKKQQKEIKALGDKGLVGEAKAIFEKYRGLNDVGMCQFIIGESFRMQGKAIEANAAYKKLITEYSESCTLLELQDSLVLDKLALQAESRMKLDPKNKFYVLPAVIKIY